MKKIIVENSEIFYSISRYHEVPSKYSYLGEGASLWQTLTKAWSKKGVNTNVETRLLKDNAKQILDTVRLSGSFRPTDVHIIDLGCGNGDPAAVLCNALPPLMYTAVDISPQMIDLALKRLKKIKDKKVEYSSFVLDFETQDPHQIVEGLCDRRHVNLFMFVGNTLGNYSNPYDLIRRIVRSMDEKDFFLVGNGLVPKTDINSLVENYDMVEERNLITLTTRRLGIDMKSVHFIWSSENEVQVIGTISQDLVLMHHTQTAVLTSGTELLLLRSRKYFPQGLSNLLTAAGITVLSKWVNPEKTNMLALCRPTFRLSR